MALQTITIGALRATAGTPGAAFGAFSSISAAANANVSWLANPFRLPDAVDVSRPLFFRLPILNALANALDGLVVRLSLSVSAASEPSGVATSLPNIVVDWPVPNPWAAGERADVPFTNTPGETWTYPAGFFTRGHYLGIGWSRIGVAPQDTYGTINLPSSVLLSYYPRCQMQCCVS